MVQVKTFEVYPTSTTVQSESLEKRMCQWFIQNPGVSFLHAVRMDGTGRETLVVFFEDWTVNPPAANE